MFFILRELPRWMDLKRHRSFQIQSAFGLWFFSLSFLLKYLGSKRPDTIVAIKVAGIVIVPKKMNRASSWLSVSLYVKNRNTITVLTATNSPINKDANIILNC